MTAIKNALKCVDLSKTFKTGLRSAEVQALKKINLEVPVGCVSGLLGPNGSGKSTMIKLSMDLIYPTEGHVEFFDQKSFSMVKNKIGFVPEKPEYSPHYTAEEILEFHAKLLKAPQSRVDEVLNQVDLMFAKKRQFGGFSKGMKQRLAIAKSLLGEPELLILDEPLSGLDPDGREALINIIENFAKKNHKTVLLSSHLLDDVQRICDHLIVLQNGELLFQGNPYSVVETEAFIVKFRDISGEVLTEASSANELPKLLNDNLSKPNLKLISIQPERQPLNDLYFKLTHNLPIEQKTKGESQP